MRWEKHIEFNPKILFGKAVIKGTRIPVYLILEKLANEYKIEEILIAYPNLTPEKIYACLYFASEKARF